MGRWIDADALYTAITDRFDYCEDILEVVEAQLTVEQDWIPCKERLPEMTHFHYDVYPFSDDVLLAVRNEYGADEVIISNYDSHFGWSLGGLDNRFNYKPLAWRPLPAPYKEDHNEP